MRQISHFWYRLTKFRSSLAERLNSWQDEAEEWVATYILWPLGFVSFGLSLLFSAMLFLTFVGGGVGVILVAIVDPVQFYVAGDMYVGAMATEFCLMIASFVTAMYLSIYFDSRNGI